MYRNISFLEPSQKWNPDLPLKIFQIIVTLLVVTGNGLLLVFIYRSRRRMLKSNLLILSLTVSDFATGLFVMPFGIYVTSFDSSQLNCELYIFWGQGLGRVSSMTIVFITIDRYLKLMYPMKHRTVWNRTEYRIIAILTAWMIGILMSTLRFVDSLYNGSNYIKGCLSREYFTIFEQLDILISVTIVNSISLVFYNKIRGIVYDRRKNGQWIQGQESKNGTIKKEEPESVLRRHAGKYSHSEMNIPSWRPTIILGLIIGFNFSFVSIPTLVYTISLMCDSCVTENVFQSTVWFYWVSTGVDPIIFALLNHHFKYFLTHGGKIKQHVKKGININRSTMRERSKREPLF